MSEARTSSSDFKRAYGDAKKQANDLADQAADLAGSANEAAQQTVGSFERAFRNMIETQPYTAAAIALGLGWLFGRMHRPF
jgi:ElaB/YqjD/DUF883 family membrane-anchored ribosome-binding protein